jgi:hypothetical protein
VLRRQFLKTGLAIGTVAITSPVSAQTRFLDFREYIYLRFCRRKPCLRRNIYSLIAQDPKHPTIQAYRDGVAAMKALPDTDPTSWTYQANIHGTALPSSQWPAGAPFATCKHNSIYFLAWHRMYLAFFERIVRRRSGQYAFCLPYWDYGQGGQAALPAPFRNPANVANALYDGTRAASINSGNALSPGTVSAANALNQLVYLGAGQFQSSLEGTPHGAVHVAISGNMGAFASAGRDPIFWLHHSNIDRLWEKWLSLGGGRSNPLADASWMSQTYTFVDENGNLVTMTVADTLETISQLNYQYEDPELCVPLYAVSVPICCIQWPFFSDVLIRVPIVKQMKIDLSAKEIVVPLNSREDAERISKFLNKESLERTLKENRVVISIDGIRTDKPLNGYLEAYLAFGAPEELSLQEPVFIGNVTTFGADPESREAMRRQAEREKEQDHDDHADGLSVSLDITEVLRKLADRTREGLVSMQLVLRPTTGVEGNEAGIDKDVSLTVDSIELVIVPNDSAEQ